MHIYAHVFSTSSDPKVIDTVLAPFRNDLVVTEYFSERVTEKEIMSEFEQYIQENENQELSPKKLEEFVRERHNRIIRPSIKHGHFDLFSDINDIGVWTRYSIGGRWHNFLPGGRTSALVTVKDIDAFLDVIDKDPRRAPMAKVTQHDDDFSYSRIDNWTEQRGSYIYDLEDAMSANDGKIYVTAVDLLLVNDR